MMDQYDFAINRMLKLRREYIARLWIIRVMTAAALFVILCGLVGVVK